MTYTYSFDETEIGNVSFPRQMYGELQQGLVRLRDDLVRWNNLAAAEGAPVVPYEHEVSDLERMIREGARQLDRGNEDVRIRGISRASLAYLRAGIEYRLRSLASELRARRQEGWPSAVVSALGRTGEDLSRIASQLDREFNVAPSPILWQVMPSDEAERMVERIRQEPEAGPWDVFISHASEDKEFVRPLADALTGRGLRVWFDEFELHVGASLSGSIHRGLAESRFGVVVLSPSFFAKEWPQWELAGLLARQIGEKRVILPVWHQIDQESVRRFAPPLADLFAVRSEHGLDAVVEALCRAIDRQ